MAARGYEFYLRLLYLTSERYFQLEKTKNRIPKWPRNVLFIYRY